MQKFLYILSEYCYEDLHGWTTLKIEQAWMAINDLGFFKSKPS